jgi:hypothetical protein
MTNKVIYINYQPITSSYYYNYFLDKCVDNAIEIEYWDLSKWFFPSVDFHTDFEFKNVKFIKSKSDLQNILTIQDIKSSIFITNITYNFKVIKLFHVLTNFNCNLVFFARGMFPVDNKSITSNFINKVLKLNFRRIVSGFKNKMFLLFDKLAILIKKYKFIKTFDVVFVAGSDGGFTIGNGSEIDLKYAEIVPINYFDYDKYLSVVQNDSTPLIDVEYCVFMDQYLANHPDIALCGLENVNSTVYYSDLNNYFEFVEREFNKKVVIAAHPKAIEYKTNNPFLGRQIFFDKTCELVKDASFVLTHHSTAISFSILFNKPIIFLNSKEIKRAMPELYRFTDFLGDYLKSEVIYFDEFNSKDNLKFNVDLNIYKDYKYKFLTSPQSENNFTSDIFIQTLFKR